MDFRLINGNKNIRKEDLIMKKLLCICGIFFIITCILVPKASTTNLEWTIKKELDLKAPALDISQSGDGQWIFILSMGEITIYSNIEDKVINRIPVDKAFDKVTHYESNNTLILTSSRENILKIIQLEAIEEFDFSGLPFLGPEDAPVTITVFADYQCPYCASLEPLIEQVLKKHPKDVKLVYKHFPISSHKFAKNAAEAALAAGIQGKFWEFHKRLFKDYKNLDDTKIQEIAKELKLDMEKLNQDINNSDIQRLILRDINDAQKADVAGIPTIFINGRRVKSRTLETLEAMIKEELES
jgi:protein-disulfide isomerase